ncbi:winged helix-turn-helix domain-containing protein [Stenotrophomonas sp. LGBM10]|uniref:winged helix-turn-helix domain-containing protein n=1 Tax=Stenotrophomonas sp. LGBM10 TaxID=3390038 RepID=UPI00398B95FE
MIDIVVVEDDERLGALIAHYLERHGYRVVLEADGAQAEATVLAHTPAAVLLDVTLPGRDGFDICRTLRPRYAGVICMLTARNDDIDQVLGLELGADDYIGKPIEPRVLLARLRAHLRRQSPARQEQSALSVGRLRIDRGSREVHLHDARVPLTSAEFDLLLVLAEGAGRIFSREDLFQSLRGISFDGADRSIDARVSRLRRKLGDDQEPAQRIKAVRGRGYLFNRGAWD